MCKIILVVIILLCAKNNALAQNCINTPNIKVLDFLYRYASSKVDSGNSKTIAYETYELTEQRIGDSAFFFKNGHLICKTNFRKFSNLVEVFDHSYLVFSFIKGSTNASGPDRFPRDSIVIFNLKTLESMTINLKNKCLTRSVDFLKLNYHFRTKSEVEQYKSSMNAITEIDFVNKKLVILNQNYQSEAFLLRPQP